MKINPGDVEFRFTSHRLSLDFLATLGERGHRNIERVATPALLAQWLLKAGVCDEGVVVPDREFLAAIELREAMARVIGSVLEKGLPNVADVQTVNLFSRRPATKLLLSPDARSYFRLYDNPTMCGLSDVARDFVVLMGGGLSRVKMCSDDTCRMHFYDNSPKNNRIWCAIEGKGCGNRAKKRAFRKRRLGLSAELEGLNSRA